MKYNSQGIEIREKSLYNDYYIQFEYKSQIEKIILLKEYKTKTNAVQTSRSLETREVIQILLARKIP
jgi:hypothetical protein